MWLSGFVCSFSCFYSFFHYCLSYVESQGWLRAQNHQLYPSVTCHRWQSVSLKRPPLRSNKSPSSHPPSSRHTLRKHLTEQTDSSNYIPVTPPRQPQQYNKHVINPANKILPSVRLPHLPGLTHLPAPLGDSFNQALCHLESWAAAVLTGYQRPCLLEFVKKTEILGTKWVVVGSILQDAGSGLDPAKHLSTQLSLKNVQQLFH